MTTELQENHQPITINTIQKLDEETTEKPMREIIKDYLSSGSKFISIILSASMATIFILEQLKWSSPIITNAPSFVVVPIIFILSLILYYFVPETMTSIQKNLQKRLKDKNEVNSYELKQIEKMADLLNTKAEELSQSKQMSIKIRQLDNETASIYKSNTPRENLNLPVSLDDNINEIEELFSDGTYMYKRIAKV